MKRSPSPTWAPRYSYSDALVNDLCAVAEARARVELLPLPADESLRLRHAAFQRSTRSSTRIEGNPLDDQAMRVAIAAADREGSKAEQEVRNYWRALDQVEEWAQGSNPLSEAWIQELHAVVIVRGRGRRRQRTPFRVEEVPVVDTVSRRIEFAPPTPADVGLLMQQLCQWWQASERLPPLIRAGLLSHRFISIHPFPDGNGRCGRLLATASLWRSGYAFRGFLSFEEWFAADREAYYGSLQLGCPVDFYEGRHDPDHSLWLEYFAAVLQRAAADLAERAQALQARQEPPVRHPWKGWIGAASSCSRVFGRGWRQARSRRISSNPPNWRSGLRCHPPPRRTGCTSGRSRGCWSPPGRANAFALGGCASLGSSGC